MNFAVGKKISNLIKRFVLSPALITNFKKHIELVKVLKPFKKQGFINHRSYLIYLFSYISKSLTTDDRLEILKFHYSFLRKNFSPRYLKQLFENGIECFKENSMEDEYTVSLLPSSMLEFEGSLSLDFKVNGTKIYTLSFTFVPGHVVNIKEHAVIYISRLQRDSKHLEKNSKATKYFNDIVPSAILMRVLEAIATSLNIRTCVGVSAKHQVSLTNEAEYLRFYSIYDEFWLNHGGKFVDNNYLFPIPFEQKYISEIQQKHRNRALKKRRRLEEIYNESYNRVSLLKPNGVPQQYVIPNKWIVALPPQPVPVLQ
jgi:uncharacterized protein VirK/YbjX